MNLLGTAGQFYMLVLLVLLFVGTGFAIWSFANFLLDYFKKSKSIGNAKIIEHTKNKNHLESIFKGGLFMAGSGWMKLAVLSFVGIIVSVAVLGLISTNNLQGMDMSSQGTNAHQLHTQQGSQQTGMNGMNVQGSTNMYGQMGSMQMQGIMNGNAMMPANQNEIMMQQYIYQLQLQLNQLQQQVGMMNGGMSGNMQMQQNSGMSGNMQMPQNSGMGGNMQMQQNSSMNNMQQSGMSGMGMMGGMGMM